ncbi:MAG: DNA replication/repair protein RecF [candidate division Zixibacteria bacterium]
MFASAFFIFTMHLDSLKLTSFRNFETLELTPAAGINVLHGKNGSGKSNLLEAIFVLCLGRSQRGNKDSDLIKNEQQSYRVEGTMHDGDRSIELAVAVMRGGRKQITINGVKSKAAELYEKFSVVAAGPEDSEILAGPPSVRRLFLDLYISQQSAKYLENITKYSRILSQKNAALKENIEFDSFNYLLAETGAKITMARQLFLETLNKSACSLYLKFSDNGNLDIKYKPSALEEIEIEVDESRIKEQFEARLKEVKEREMILKTSVVGPHRDEIEFDINSFPARTHGSQGEWRSAAIALKLSVYQLLKEKRGFSPILLLDEIFAELDEDRSAAVIDSFNDLGQLFLTTALEPPARLAEKALNLNIDNGQVEIVS